MSLLQVILLVIAVSTFALGATMIIRGAALSKVFPAVSWLMMAEALIGMVILKLH